MPVHKLDRPRREKNIKSRRALERKLKRWLRKQGQCIAAQKLTTETES